MKAMTQHAYGAPDTLELRDVDMPTPQEDEVLIRVAAASVNPADWANTVGLPYIARPAFGLTKPRNPIRGSDVAGIVEAVGSKVTRFSVGDEVFGVGKGAYAEYTVCREKHLVTKPAHVTFEQAAAVPMAGLVALQAMRDKAQVQPGQHVLIIGAGGGIGTFTVQVAKSMGAEVTGVCSAGNVDLVQSIGADHVIDYDEQDVTQGSVRYDVILDNAGAHTLGQLRGVLTETGTLIPNAGSFDNHWFAGLGQIIAARTVTLFTRQRLLPFLSMPNQEDLATLGDLVASGAVVPVVGRTYPLADAGSAIDYVGAGHARGKVVIVP